MLNREIGIITFQDAINYGATLQTYALQKYLLNLGCNCEVINYKCEKFKDDYKCFNIYNKSFQGIVSAILKTPINMNKKQKFIRFRNKNIALSKKKFTVDNIVETNRIYQKFITGSDQVWNLSLTGNDKSYFLDFVWDNKERFSYAASMGSVKLSEDEEKVISKELFLYKNISVREKDAQKCLERITPKPIIKVLDPVFLLSREQWNQLIQSEKIKYKYILAYILHEDEVYKVAERISKETGVKIICLQNNLKKPIKANYIFSAGPEEFLALIKNATYVVTDSFHGAAFSIIFRKTCKIVLKKSLTNLNGRLNTLVDDFNIKESIVDGKSTKQELLSSTCYDEEKIQNIIIKSKQFLENILGE